MSLLKKSAIRILFVTLASPIFVHAQTNINSANETAQGSSSISISNVSPKPTENETRDSQGNRANENPPLKTGVKFRGFKDADEDLPFMSDNWKVTFFQLAATEPARFDDAKSTSFFFYNYFSLNYKLDETSRFAIRPVFQIDSPGMNKYNESVDKWEIHWGDWYLQYSKFDLFQVGPFGARTNLRLYAPTSDGSQENTMITQFHPELYLETSLRRGTSVEFAFKGDYYWQRDSAYSFKTESGKVIYTTNKEMELESYIELNQRITRQFHVKPRLDWLDTWKRGSPANNLSSSHTTTFAPGLGIEWRPTSNFNTTVIYSNNTLYYANRRFIYKDKSYDHNNDQLVALTNYRF